MNENKVFLICATVCFIAMAGCTAVGLSDGGFDQCECQEVINER